MKKKTIIIIAVAITAITGGLIWQNRQSKIAEEIKLQEIKNEEQKFAPGINGLEIPESSASKRPLAVMIENHPDSRPQFGLSEADIVYETLAEGGITRFLALFQSAEPKSIGPVRSTRPYFNFLANQWSPLFAHSGGSQTALKELQIGFYRNILDADEMLNGKYYKRDNSKFAPHNLFTSSENLRQLMADRGGESWKSPSPMFASKAIPTDQLKTEVTEITIPFSTASYLAKFQYDPATNTYKRLLAGKPHIDKGNGSQISTKNVLVQFASGNIIPEDPTLAMEFRLDRSGKAFLFTGGGMTAGSWKYQNGITTFTDTAGNLLTLQPGPIWIAIMPANLQNNVSWK